ncbi:prealbumin-like fold domain-containing protein [Lysobacter silvisoli]|uniref:prealbumin-like fold domain-containing protein n=1 Tax=Lysobacter silvisoli TaxID=2293254 RepID=UPI001313EE1E|nr:DUF11 domain-containing protein [Lysobacter silvisoli]
MGLPAGRWLLALILLLAAMPAVAQIQRSFRNLGFEPPQTVDVNPNCFIITRAQDVQGWKTSEPNQSNAFPGSGPPNNCFNGNPGTGLGVIEIWNTAFAGVSAGAGTQFSELNAWSDGRLSQDVCLFQGEQVGYSFLHRGRNSAATGDTAEFNVDSTSNTVVAMSTTTTGAGGTTSCGGTAFASPQSGTVSGASEGLVQSATCSTATSTNGWRRYTGTFVYGGTSGAHNLGFQTANGGSSGNFLDDVDILLSPVIQFTGSIAGTRGEGAAANTLSPQIIVVGTVPAGGLVLDFINDAAATATQGIDYTINTVTIPAGRYETPTTITLTNLVTVNNDTVIENNETIDLRMVSRAGAYVVGSTQTCGAVVGGAGVVTIVDNDVDVATTKVAVNANPPPGGTATFTVVYQNNAARPTVGTAADLTAHDLIATLTDPLQAGYTAFAWTCAAAGGAVCPAASGAGAINATNVSLPAGTAGAAGASLTYTVTATLAIAQCTAAPNTSTITLNGTTLQEGTSAQSGFVTPTPGGTANNSATAFADPGCLTLNKTVTPAAARGPFTFGLTNTGQTSGTATTPAGGTVQVDGNAVAGVQAFGIVAAGVAVTIDENAMPNGYSVANATCSNGSATVGSLRGTIYTIAAADVVGGTDFTCTFTNANGSDLLITKTNTPVDGPSDGANDTVVRGAATVYQLRVTNNGPATVAGAVVRDAPGAGITCPAGNAVTITGSGVPASTFTVSNLTGAGITLGTLNSGQSATLSFQCTVN